ncbi:hybrid sensor histidine kinase/response regulator [Thaumasiovibrio subtropicus]|uniref:hybrid sensor histidine kinase/response regulator n=1 Tax=Thaumasiovibrio subtropicus TaxID=1891207 RepID=UPI000B363B13|nr:hybrid sensor histidine kinase/response regulator [Thaumasiovibrio subtropicus]
MKRSFQSLAVKGGLFLLVLFCSLCAVIFYVIETRGKLLVEETVKQHLAAESVAVVHTVGNLASNIEGLTTVLAGEASKGDREALLSLMESLFTNPHTGNLIAGGGVWPQPYKGSNGFYLDSLFLAKDRYDHLDLIDDYNLDPANPYFNEEWYVPNYWLSPGQIYWSQSYTDPHTHEPMVTCSMPYFIGDEFAGVVTIDVRLSGLHPFLAEKGERMGGYLTLLDRAGRFIYYPQPQMVMEHTDNGPVPVTADKLAQRDHRYTNQALRLTQYTHTLRRLAESRPEVLEVANMMLKRSSSINYNYALLAALAIVEQGENRYPSAEVIFDDVLSGDPILEEDAYLSAVVMPQTQWILMMSVPERNLSAQVRKLESSLLSVLLPGVLLAMACAYVFFHRKVMRPLNKVQRALADQETSGDVAPLPVLYRDELGGLIECFNQRSESLIATRQEALAAAEAKQQFLATMSHEIRTPMNGIMGAADLIRQSQPSKEVAHFVDMVDHSAQSLMRLINDILDFSKLSASKLELEAVPFNITEVGQYVYELLNPIAIEKSGRVDFKYWVDDDLPSALLGDPTRIQQILINLVGNALKFTEKGHVYLQINLVSMSQDAATLKMSVVDTGVGIPAEKMEMVFEQFTQADQSVTREYGGTGLGLAITQDLIELMGGDLDVNSQVEQGSTFSVTLTFPLVETAVANASLAAAEPIAIPRGKSVLIAEDNQINRKIAKAKLNRLGFIVESAMDGKQALSMCDTRQYDVILMDINMPLIDGYTVTRQLRSQPGLNQLTPVIAMTANVGQKDIDACIDAGMQAHVGKPIDDTHLQQLLAQIFSSKATQTETSADTL